MPRFLHLAVLLLLFAAALWGQGKPSKKPAEKKPEPAEAVAPDDLVILIPGACQTEPLEFAVRDCIRGVTRRQFEALAHASDRNGTPLSRVLLAHRLGEIILLSNEAKKRNLPKDPEVQALLQFAQLQALANLLIARTVDKQERAETSDAEITSYYEGHIRDFQSAELLRIAVPSRDGGTSSQEDAALAELLRVRCAAGEDPAKLQAEAAQRVGQNASAPVDLKEQRRSLFPATQQPIFDLKTGECLALPADKTGFFLYKMVSLVTAPIKDERNTIVQALQSAKVKQELDELRKQNVIRLNGRYFTNAGTPAAPPQKSEPK